jgi:proliferating cell nuclear antigen
MSFSALTSVDTLQDALDPVSALVDECKIRLNEDGLSIRAVDPANVGMVDMSLATSGFEAYEADGGVIGVSLDRLEDFLSMGDSGDLVSLDLNEQTRKLDIHISGLSYTLALFDPDSIRREPDTPDLDLPATIVLTGDDIDYGITAADLVSDHISLRADETAEEFHIEAQGDTDDVDLTFTNDDLLAGSVDEAAESLFSLDYLKDMSRAMDTDAEVSLLLGSEMPVKLRYSRNNGFVGVVYMLAPRIQSE